MTPAKHTSECCVFFSPTETWGGVEKNVKLRAKHLIEKGCRVVVVILKNQFRDQFSDIPDLEIVSVQSRGGDLNLAVVFNYYRLLKKYNPDVVFVASKKDWWLVSFAAHLAKVPNTILYLGIARPIPDNFKYRKIIKSFKTTVLVNSNSLRDSLLANPKLFDKNNLERIYNGFNLPDNDIKELSLREELSLSKDTVLVGCAGRLAKMKGFDLWPDILKHLPENVHIVHIGTGSNEEKIKKQLIATEMQHRVHLLGYMTDSARFFKSIDIFMLCSRSEGMANVLCEAMSHGKPCISTRVPGSEELLDEGKYGILTNIEDTEALAKGISDIINGKVHFHASVLQDRIIKHFSYDQMMKQTELLFSASFLTTIVLLKIIRFLKPK